MWKDDDELFALMRQELFPAVVGDILDTMGLLHQFLRPDQAGCAPTWWSPGRAMPVLEAACFAAVEAAGQLPVCGSLSGCCSRRWTTCGRTRFMSPPAMRRSSRCGAG